MISFILKLLTGAGGITGDLRKAYEAKLTAQNDHDKLVADLDVKSLEAEVEAKNQATKIRLETAGFWEMRLAVGLVAVATGTHYAAIVLDSVFLFSWNVAKLPAPFDAHEHQILLSLFGLQGAIGIGSALVRRLK